MAAVLDTIESTIPSGAIPTEPVAVMPPLGEVSRPEPAVTDVTPPEVPLAALVSLPWASTVMLALVYAPGVTAVLAREMVPVVVTGPPVSPVPVATEVTVPVPGAGPLMVTFPVEPLRVMFGPATRERTPVLFRVTEGVEPPPESPVPATTVVTGCVPLLASVTRPNASTFTVE